MSSRSRVVGIVLIALKEYFAYILTRNCKLFTNSEAKAQLENPFLPVSGRGSPRKTLMRFLLLMFLLLVLLKTLQALIVGVTSASFPHHAQTHTSILNDRSSFLHVVVVVVTLVDEWYGASKPFLPALSVFQCFLKGSALL